MVIIIKINSEYINKLIIDQDTIEKLFHDYLTISFDKATWVLLQEKLKVYFEETKDPKAEQLYYTINSKISQVSYDNDGILEFGTKANQSAQKNGFQIYQALAANALGNYYRYQGNYLTAFHNYWEAYHLFTEHEDQVPHTVFKTTCHMLSQNIAACLSDSGEYENAIKYYQKVLDQIPLYDRNTNDEILVLMISNNIANNYNHLAQYENARVYLREVNDLAKKHKNIISDYYPQILVINYIILYQLDDLPGAGKIMEQLQQSPKYWEDANAMENVLSFLVKTKQFELFLFFYEPIYARAVKEDLLKLQIGLIDGLRQYYESYGNEDGCSRTYKEIGKLLVRQLQERKLAMQAAVHSSLVISEQQEDQKKKETERELIIYKSEYDELTDIPNRYKLSEFCRTAFELAKLEQLSVSVELIDIDYFKQVNDCYGHAQGDLCLKLIASEIKSHTSFSDGQLCARYGGDEFVIVRVDRSDEEILRKMELLKKAIQNLAIPNEYSPIASVVTISQGAVNRIPAQEDSLETFLKYADIGLYEAKKLSRNTMVLNQY